MSSVGAQDAVIPSVRGRILVGMIRWAWPMALPNFLRSDVSMSPDDATLSSLSSAGCAAATAVHQRALLVVSGS